jgi:3-isopropylmalate/(R)-2-methylmalate dehydratase small subunit
MKIEHVTGPGIPLLLDDIDTDRIIPARFLRCVSFEGLGEHAFEDDRRQDPQHPFNQPRFRQARVLVTGRNFGCGSSREHAPQSLMRWGIAAIVAESFAEIFFGNCTSLGIPAVCAARSDLTTLAQAINADPTQPVTVDLTAMEVRCGKLRVPCTMPAGARSALVSGEWDFLGQLLENQPAIRATAERLPYLHQFAPESR